VPAIHVFTVRHSEVVDARNKSGHDGGVWDKGVAVAKLKIMSARSMHEAVTALAYGFTDASGHETELSFGTVGALQKRLDAGERGDVLISSVPMMDRLEQTGALFVGSRRTLATTRIGVAIRDGATAPDIATPAAFRQTLIKARSIAFSDAAVGGSAGVYLARLFVEMGLAETIRQKGMPQQSGGEVAESVARGEAEIGMTLIAEIVPVQGARVVGPLPAPLGADTTYCAAVMAISAAAEAGRDFIAMLTYPDARDVWEEAGFEVTFA
jgi:molybdate transport system substrate-binding protein